VATTPSGHVERCRAPRRWTEERSEFDKVQIEEVTKGDPFTLVTKVVREPARISIDYALRVPHSMLVRTADTTNGNLTLHRLNP
jgi:hypothetical protein